jgi:hypothetical protein
MAEFKFRYIRLRPGNDIASVVEDVKICLISLERVVAIPDPAASNHAEKYKIKNSTFTIRNINNSYRLIVDAPHLYEARDVLREISRKLYEANAEKYPHRDFFNDCLAHEVIRD